MTLEEKRKYNDMKSMLTESLNAFNLLENTKLPYGSTYSSTYDIARAIENILHMEKFNE